MRFRLKPKKAEAVNSTLFHLLLPNKMVSKEANAEYGVCSLRRPLTACVENAECG